MGQSIADTLRFNTLVLEIILYNLLKIYFDVVRVVSSEAKHNAPQFNVHENQNSFSFTVFMTLYEFIIALSFTFHNHHYVYV